jgi:hypothetical protein
MNRKIGLLLTLLLAGCAPTPQLPSWNATALLPALPADCPGAGGASATPLVPGGVSIVRSQGRDVVLVAARSCVMTVDALNGAAEALPTHGDAIAPTMVDGQTNGVAFSSSLSGSVRAIDVAGAITFNYSGLKRPLGLRLMPGGMVLVAEHDAGRIIRIGPASDSPARLVIDGLDGPVGLVVADATLGYVTEARGGRVTSFRLDRFEKATVVAGLSRPEGIARMSDGRLAVLEAGSRRLIAVDPATGATELLAGNLPIAATPGEQADHATAAVSGLAAAADGTLYASVSGDRSIWKFAPQTQPQR